MKTDIYKLNLHETVIINGMNITRIPGGWIYEVNAIPIKVDFNKEFEPKKPKQTTIEIGNTVTENLINYYNSKNIIKTQISEKIVNEITSLLRTVLKIYTKEQIKESIDNYSEAYKSEFFFSTPWNLVTFLKQKNAMPSFINGGSKQIQYKEWKNKNTVDIKESIQIKNFKI